MHLTTRSDGELRRAPLQRTLMDRVQAQLAVLRQRELGGEVDLAQPGVHRQLLVDGELLDAFGKPAAATHSGQVTDRRALDEIALQHRMRLVLSRVRARTNAQRREISRRRVRAFSSGVQTSSKKPTASSCARTLASILSVLALRDTSRTALGLASTTRRTCGSMIRAIASAFAVASITTSRASCGCA